MNVFLKQINLFQPGANPGFKTVDVLIKDGKYHQINDHISPPSDIPSIDGTGLYACPGWLDIGTQIGEPGFEHREDLESVSSAAAKGGFSHLMAFPNTFPVLDNKAQIEFLNQNNRQNLVQIKAAAALSKGCEGKELSEFYDLHKAGALAFSDGSKSIQDSGLLMRALLYSKGFQGTIINSPNDDSISKSGQVNESSQSISMGLKGIPALAEELMLQRDIELLEYTDSKLLVANISTAASVDMIKKAKAKGLNIYCYASINNLSFNEQDIIDYDTHFKLFPPLRSSVDQKALIEAFANGTIDCLSAQHIPLEEDLKKKEFTLAEFGCIGLETFLPLSLKLREQGISLERLCQAMAIKTREILGLEIPEVTEGALADLFLFNDEEEWIYASSQIASKSKNSILLGSSLVGKVKAIMNNNRIIQF